MTPLGYRSRAWTVRQVMGVGTAEETNQRLRYLISQGQTGISLTGMGYFPFESSDPRAEGLVGVNGVWIDTLADVERVLDGVDLDRISITQTANSIPAFCMIVSVAEKRGIPPSRLRGTIQNTVPAWGEGPARRGNHCIDIIEHCSRTSLSGTTPASRCGMRGRRASPPPRRWPSASSKASAPSAPFWPGV